MPCVLAYCTCRTEVLCRALAREISSGNYQQQDWPPGSSNLVAQERALKRNFSCGAK